MHNLYVLVDIPHKSWSLDQPHKPVFTDSTHREQMSELYEGDCNQLLDVVSSWWELHGSVNMLKVLLSEFDCIHVTKLQELNKPIELFRLLLGNGLISQSNIDVLVEVVILCEQRGVELKIKKMEPTFPDLSKVVIRNFSDHRRNLIKFGTAMSKDNKDRIGYWYDLNVKKLPDPWCLILELEYRKILTVDTRKEFIKRLMKNEMIAEAEALNTF
ncbi:uncharacterized protein LOC117106025 [Anneissia japonica]|uniref:uncharacterized protein LOC117106025 n=1 Tax=Anneissia japonica TaxID=1529436 RepID=UPI001425654C|nr:uncharacterized protein LOC117106025 [Anneissia japonica]